MNFGERLKYLRNKQSLTQEELADKTGVHRATIAGYETKGKEPSYSTLKKLAQALNCSIDYLLDNINEKPNNDENDLCYYKQYSLRNDLKELIEYTAKLNPTSVNRIISIIKIIEEEVSDRLTNRK
ncbi:MAG: helix-turn-helix transcriptional regulator [Tepidanaerobacteraceae bacterium]|nr:helix-turn-helix transcriptional regulator [Tepidanaerobacteraceae bacterium]